jgi:hypothetical protein
MIAAGKSYLLHAAFDDCRKRGARIDFSKQSSRGGACQRGVSARIWTQAILRNIQRKLSEIAAFLNEESLKQVILPVSSTDV